MDSEKLQKEHYERIHAKYEVHYDDKYSRKYRSRFIYTPLFEDIELSGKSVLEAMCGSGQTTEYLLSKGSKITGLDISSEMIKSFKNRWPQCQAICRSFFDNGIRDSSFDCVVIIGGLHHLQPGVDDAVDEVYRILKPGGYFCFVEPHKGSLPDIFRGLWMKADPLFEKNESAIDPDALQSKNATRFEFIKTLYRGGISYLLVINSMVLRIPLALKPLYAPVAMAFESIFGFSKGKKLSCFMICQWKKKY